VGSWVIDFRNLFNSVLVSIRVVSSPLYLLQYYVNDIITNLECSGYGCQVASKYVGGNNVC